MLPESSMLLESSKVLFKEIPVTEVYRDLLKPGTQEAGRIIENILKTAHLVAFPLQILAHQQDKFRNFLQGSIAKVPKTRLISPAVQILMPCIEGTRYEPEDTPIYIMFSNLLSNSMDKENVDKCHPAYPRLIQQLSSDEAAILNFLETIKEEEAPLSGWIRSPKRNTASGDTPFPEISRNWEYSIVLGDLTYAHKIDFYINHLEVLGLLELESISHNQKRPTNEKIKLSFLGIDFMQACQRP